MTILGWDVFRASIAALALSPLFPAVAPGIATADTQLIENCPKVTETGGVILSDTATECPTNGSYELNAAPQEPDFPNEWGEPFYGPGLIIGGFGPGPEQHGGQR
ncbi:MAG: hypothetical protein KDB71_04395 [Mycobacterium sp.]|nr:hypothetical protein [Mycobacterium sp.]